MKNAALTFVIASTLGSFNLAHAEGLDPVAMKKMYDATRNSSGLITYCVDKGFLKADSTESAKKMVAYVAGIPGGMDTSGGDKSEAYGQEGKVMGQDGQYKSLEIGAPQGVEAWCKGADEGIRKGLESVGL
ncbi:hypothetical protein PUP68_19265 [Pseudomonas chlororaphis]|uniref:hypothetical protein n=1 Tax=Pseudomonas chlororaphis TaxID=587753 RepID=UPI002367C95B|nr:hypothetical protein [Pseudomonas chlororaphis]WDG77762.1 hypothetical protein PUP77_25595 [Pseudomonas chlororaphis]WDG83001.1 hypothetical protein PUP68_19265 [Pseudomonas chlororaphis]